MIFLQICLATLIATLNVYLVYLNNIINYPQEYFWSERREDLPMLANVNTLFNTENQASVQCIITNL